MDTIRRVLFPTDFSPCAESAFWYALALAQSLGAELHILHVCEHGGWGHIGQEKAEALKAEVSAFVESRFHHYFNQAGHHAGLITTRLVFGERPSVEIAGYVEKEGIGCVVIGSSGTSGFKRLIHGSTAERVLRRVRVPILWVHEADLPSEETRKSLDALPAFRKFLVPVDFSDCSLEALRLAGRLGKSGAEIHVLHVLEDIFPLGFDVGMVFPLPDLQEGRVEVAQSRLDRLLAECSPEGCRVTGEVLAGIPALEILEKVQAGGFGLVVMGVHGKDAESGPHMGSVTDKVIRHASCPVLTGGCPEKES